jgi:IS5 family transposase
MGQRSFFDVENRLRSVSKTGDPLERLAAAIPWESFRQVLAQVHEKERKSDAGRKPRDVVLMFKVLILQSLYNLADAQVEYQVRDRRSFARFLGLGIEDEVPDATTVWRFRERLEELGRIEPLFDRFGDRLAAEGSQVKQGQIVDADNADAGVWADSAYRSGETEAVLADAGYTSHICEKGHAGQLLIPAQEAKNRRRSKVRARVEHVFGFQQNSMGGKLIRTIGLARAEVKIGLMNMTDNLMRYLQLTKRREGAPAAA